MPSYPRYISGLKPLHIGGGGKIIKLDYRLCEEDFQIPGIFGLLFTHQRVYTRIYFNGDIVGDLPYSIYTLPSIEVLREKILNLYYSYTNKKDLRNALDCKVVEI